MRFFLPAALLLAVSLFAAPIVHAKPAADFPPGYWTDGKYRSLEDFEGEVVVLFFYEANCPKCRDAIPQRNEIVKQYRGKPVTFLAIAAGDSIGDARSYGMRTALEMPIFADNLDIMQKRYGMKISMNNIYQFRVIGPDGQISGLSMDPATIDKALANVEEGDGVSRWDIADYHERLESAVEHAQDRDFDRALASAATRTSDRDEAVKAAAEKLEANLLSHGRAMLDKAEKLKATSPIEALKAYQRVEESFGRHEIGKEADAAIDELKKLDLVQNEDRARRMYGKLAEGMAKAKKDQRVAVAQYAASIFEKYPDTPTGQKAKVLAQELAAK